MRNCAEVDHKKVKSHPNGEIQKKEVPAKNRKRKSTTTEASNSDPEFDPGRTTVVGSYDDVFIFPVHV